MSDPLQGENTGELRGIFLFEWPTEFARDLAAWRAREQLLFEARLALRVTKPKTFLIADVS